MISISAACFGLPPNTGMACRLAQARVNAIIKQRHMPDMRVINTCIDQYAQPWLAAYDRPKSQPCRRLSESGWYFFGQVRSRIAGCDAGDGSGVRHTGIDRRTGFVCVSKAGIDGAAADIKKAGVLNAGQNYHKLPLGDKNTTNLPLLPILLLQKFHVRYTCQRQAASGTFSVISSCCSRYSIASGVTPKYFAMPASEHPSCAMRRTTRSGIKSEAPK